MATIPSITVREKVWLARDGRTLVRDGHKDAASLVAIPGKKLTQAQVSRYSNGEAFFSGVETPTETVDEKRKPLKR